MYSTKTYAKVFVNTLRGVGTISCLLIFLIWSKMVNVVKALKVSFDLNLCILQAVEKLIKVPISSSISYKNGDDNNGKLGYPIVTFCPQNLDHFSLFPTETFALHCKCSSNPFAQFKCRKDYLWGNVFKDCYKNTRYDSITKIIIIKFKFIKQWDRMVYNHKRIYKSDRI